MFRLCIVLWITPIWCFAFFRVVVKASHYVNKMMLNIDQMIQENCFVHVLLRFHVLKNILSTFC